MSTEPRDGSTDPGAPGQGAEPRDESANPGVPGPGKGRGIAPWRARFRARVRERFEELSGADETPRRLGIAVGLGVLCGCSPFLGFQTVIAVAAAFLLRQNKLAVLIGLQISMPPITPLVVLASLELGELMVHRRLMPFTIAQLRAMPAREVMARFFVDLSVGGLTLGLVAGFILGALAERWVIRRRARARPA